MLCSHIPCFARSFQLANNVRWLHTAFSQKKHSCRDRVWSRWMIQSKDGMMHLKAQTLPPRRFDDCIELMMKHYLNDEGKQIASDDNDNSAAIPTNYDYKRYLTALLRQPTTHTHVYLLDDDTPDPEIVGFSSMMLISKDDWLPVVQEPETNETKNYCDIYDALTALFPARELMQRYQVDCYYQDVCMAFTPKYEQLGIAKYDSSVRRLVCQAHEVPVTTAWCTMASSPRVCEDGWEVVVDISFEKLAGYLGVDLEDAPPRCTLLASRTM